MEMLTRKSSCLGFVGGFLILVRLTLTQSQNLTVKALDCYECIGEEECKNPKPTRCRLPPTTDHLACFKVNDDSKPSKGCQKADPAAGGKDKCEKVKVGGKTISKCVCHKAICNHAQVTKYRNSKKLSTSLLMTILLGILELF